MAVLPREKEGCRPLMSRRTKYYSVYVFPSLKRIGILSCLGSFLGPSSSKNKSQACYPLEHKTQIHTCTCDQRPGDI